MVHSSDSKDHTKKLHVCHFSFRGCDVLVTDPFRVFSLIPKPGWKDSSCNVVVSFVLFFAI